MVWKPLRGSEEATKVGSSLERLALQLGMPSTKVTRAVFAQWGDIVGPKLAEHAKPVAVVAGTLTVVVDEQRWLTQLRWMAPKLLERIQEVVGEGFIAGIDVRLEHDGVPR